MTAAGETPAGDAAAADDARVSDRAAGDTPASDDAVSDGAATGLGQRPVSRVPRVALAVVLAVLLVVSGYVLGSGGDRIDVPGDNSVAAGFARDMQRHHAQAVQLALIVRDRTDDSPTRTLAYDIALTQQQQIGQLYGWLDQWGLSQVSAGPPLAWMPGGMSRHGAETGDGTMPGMASAAQIRELEQASDRRAETRFLELMIPHHEAGVRMSEVALRHTGNPQVRRLATLIVSGQRSEIELMRQMLHDRRQRPE